MEYIKIVKNYRLIDQIGSGGFSRVFIAVNTDNNDIVAIKMIEIKLLKSHNLELLKNEVNILLNMDHPNIIKLKDFVKTNKHYYLVFEYCNGGDISDFLLTNGPIPEPVVQFYMKSIINGLNEIHSEGILISK